MILLKGVATGLKPEIAEWDQPTVRSFNGKMVEGRPTKGYGVSNFNYAGKLYEPEPWTDQMLQLKEHLEKLVRIQMKRKIEFTFCLCGLYKDGTAFIPHHSDTVPTRTDVVVGVSYGAPRVLEWREYNILIKKKTNTSRTHLDSMYLRPKTKRYLLEDGDVYLFDGKSQMKSTHSIPSIEGVGERINLTFRSGI